MEQRKKKELRAKYEERKPDMGIICWQSGADMWIAKSTDAKADYNSSLFQLKLGSYPNQEMQKKYQKDPESFTWSLLKKLDYKEREDDHSDDLELLYMMCTEEYPDAKQMKRGKK